MKYKLYIVLTLLLASCVKEQLCDIEHPHTSTMSFSYDWSNITQYAMQQPDSMYIIVDRVVNQHTSALAFDTKKGNGHYLSDLPSSLSQSNNHGISAFQLHSGEYKFVTVNYSSENFDYSQMNAIISRNNSVRFGDISLTYKTYPYNDKHLEKPTEGWADNNSYTHNDGSNANFVLASSTPISVDSTTIKTLEANTKYTTNFKPTMITQNIDIFFDIKKDIHNISFVIDSVYTVISGIPHKINLGTGALDITNTNKMIFKTKFVNPAQIPSDKSSTISDSPANTKIRCYRNVNILGIAENQQSGSDIYVGPGLMQLIIYTKIFDPTVPGNYTYKKITGIVNLHKSLENAKLQTFDPELKIYKKTREHTDLYISLDLTLTKDQLLGTDDSGIAKWEEKTVPSEYNIY